jgi:serine/threonine protein kinase
MIKSNIFPDLPFSQAKVGPKMAVSGEHSVYRYGDKEVIKFPAGPIHYANNEEAYRKILNEFQLAKRYLGEFIAPASIFTYKKNNKKAYCIIQKFIKGTPLKIEDLQNKDLKEKLEELIKANREMRINTGYSFEFFGIRGLFFHRFLKKMENVLVDESGNLKIIDFGMISEINMVSSSPVLRSFIQWALKRQSKILKESYLAIE